MFALPCLSDNNTHINKSKNKQKQFDLFHWDVKGALIHIQGRQIPPEKGSTLKGKNLLPLGANSFCLELTSFQEGLVCRKGNRKSQKLSPLAEMAKIPPGVVIFLNNYYSSKLSVQPQYVSHIYNS